MNARTDNALRYRAGPATRLATPGLFPIIDENLGQSANVVALVTTDKLAAHVVMLLNLDEMCAHVCNEIKQALPGRTSSDAINESERLLAETFEQLDPANERDCWFMTRITKIREAPADRPKVRAGP